MDEYNFGNNMLSDCEKEMACQPLVPPASCSVKHQLPLGLEKSFCHSSARKATELLGSPSERGEGERARLERAQLPGKVPQISINTKSLMSSFYYQQKHFINSTNILLHQLRSTPNSSHEACLASCKGKASAIDLSPRTFTYVLNFQACFQP